ncbi:unnamed protein product [Protopolystoma xenopodis]|uniref:C2H2-type domain-containing protein n=1 Tax=Protopolystoma xenopodis TaxID=117903 RepID=A0A3S5AD01_9PLAT|nr:unnamed protein product [Protopolystoma xenopodis]
MSSTLDPSSLASLPASSLLPSSCSKASVTPATPLIDQTPPLPSLPPLPLLPPLPPLSILPPLPPLSLESTSCVVPRDLSSLGGGIVSSADANVCGRPPFVCEVCGKQFALRNVINRHRRELHYGVPTKHCPHCPMGYFRQSHLDKHIASKHKQLPLGSATGSNSVNSGSTSGKQRRQLLPALMGSRRSAPLIASRLASDQT